MLRCKPYYREKRNCWYVLIRGTEHKLGSDKEAAFTEFHRLMSTDAPVTDKTTVADLIERFLTWMKENRKPSTHEWYRNHCASFVKHVGRRLKVSDLKAYHVDGWLKVHGKNKSKVTVGSSAGRSTKNTGSDNSKTYLNGGCRAISRAMNWAKKQGLILTSPIAGIRVDSVKFFRGATATFTRLTYEALQRARKNQSTSEDGGPSAVRPSPRSAFLPIADSLH